MSRRPLVIALIGSFVTIASIAGVALWRDAQGAAALASGESLLNAPFAEAPELHDLNADRVDELLEEAESYGAVLPAGLRSEVIALGHHGRHESVFATGALTAARQEDGWTVRRHVLAAAIAREAGDRQTAWDHAREALALDPEAPRALLMKADLALDRDDVRAATNALRQLSAVEPSVAAVQNRLGLALEMAGDAEEAEVAFERATRLDDTHHGAFINLARARRQRGDLDGALEAFETAAGLQPGDVDAWLGVGLAALDVGDTRRAEEALERADELAPHDPAPQLALGELARVVGSSADAVDAYRAALARNNRDATTWVKLGNALVLDDQMHDGMLAFREALSRDPQSAAALNGLGAALAQSGDPEAEHALVRAAALDPADPNPLLNLALLREREGSLQEAAEAWRGALVRSPNHPVATARLARLAAI